MNSTKTGDLLSDPQLIIANKTNETNNSSLVVAFVAHFNPIEIWVIVLNFIFSLVLNVMLASSVIMSSRNHKTIRSGNNMPVVDLILLIMSIFTITKVLVRSGLQILCLYGICFVGIPLCYIHGFLNSLLHYIYLWTLTLFVQDRYIKNRAHHDYISKCSSLVVIVTLIGVIFMTSVHVCGPIWGFARYEFLRDEITCTVNWKSRYSCSYLMFSVALISSPASVPLIVWTITLICKSIWKRQHLRQTGHRLSNDSPISVSLTSTVASSSMALLSKSKVMSESSEIFSVILTSLAFLLTSAPKNLLDAAHGCTSLQTSHFYVFWASVTNEIGSTLIVPLILIAIHPKMRCSFCKLFGLCYRHMGFADHNQQHETIYLTTRPTPAQQPTASTSNSNAVTVI